MRKALNRRAVLKSGTALVAATVVGVVQAQAIEANPDAKLQALYAAYREADANACDAASKADFLDLPEEVQQPLDEAVDDAWDVWRRVVEGIAGTPAQGLAGLEVKLLVWEEINMQPIKDDSCCARSALKDVKRMNGSKVDGAKPAIALLPDTVSNPGDKLLTESFAEWIWRWESTESETDEDIDANCFRCCELERLMIETKADTLAGITAKEKWLEYPGNFEGIEYCPASFPMFQSLMADVKRIGGQHV